MPARGRTTTAWRWTLGVAVVVQLVVLYAPSAPSPPIDLPVDKVVHFVIFGAVAFSGIRAGVRPGWLVAALLTNAVASELIQYAVLPHRSGDWRDALADAVGILVGTALALRRPRGADRGERARMGA